MRRTILALPLAVLALAGLAWAQTVVLEVYAPDNALPALSDAGYTVQLAEGPYRKVSGPGLSDGGARPMPPGVTLMDSVTPFACACSTGSGCTVPLSDGGRAEAPQGATLSPGWSGVGCNAKPCVVLFGKPGGWPAGCPCPSGGC